MTISIEFIVLQENYVISCILTPARFLTISYALFNSRRSLSAIIAINSELVGFPLAAEMV